VSPAIADAKVAGRVQGLQSHFSDLTLRDGRNLAIELGGLTPTPTLNRGIEESSSVGVGVYDPDLRLLDLTLIAEKWDASLDGLHFRYLGTKKQRKNFAITLEDRDVALLRELTGPKKALRDKVTRAEFVKSLVEEVRPSLDFYCPQLHVKPPIEKKAQGKKAKEEAKANRGKGIGAAKHLTIEGVAATAAQIELGDKAGRIAEAANAPFIVQVALFAALMVESRLGDAAPGNVLQALGSGGAPIGSAEEEISGFLTGKPKWTGTTAMGYHRDHPEATYYEIAQEVQASGAGESTRGKANYGQFGDEAREWVEAFGGEAGEDTGTTTVVEPYTFEVGKKETYWDAIQRLAKEVNWRAFVVAGRFFFIDELELARGMVRLAIKREPGESKPSNPGIEDVDFDYNKNKPVTEVTVTAFADVWKVPPGAVITLEGYGPASMGFGDAPVKANAKGQKIGLSSNRNAKTGVGRARYIVSKISSPLGGSTGTRLVTIILKKPTAPLPEKAATTKTTTGAGGSAASGEYVNPFPDGATRSRIDQGVDFTGSGRIVAIGTAKILATGAPGWPEGGGVLYQLLDGPRAQQVIFVYEGVDATVHTGQKVNAGDTIAHFRRGGSIEIGFADSSGVPISHSEYVEGKETKSGKEMNGFLTSIGAP
jgi:hypothetical protein